VECNILHSFHLNIPRTP